MQGDFQFNNFTTQNPSVNGVNAAAPVTASNLGGLSSSLLSNDGGGYVAVEYVFLQFAGFTFGKSSSAYATPWNGYPGNNSSFLLGGNDSVTGVNNIQYTAQFGNGVSGTIGLDDPTIFNRTVIDNLALGITAGGTGTNAYGGLEMPGGVGNNPVAHGWGAFSVL